jgi:cyclopropane-fatty-acyl-phospholipid synthase
VIYEFLFEQTLRKLSKGALVVDYWGQQSKTYGKGKPYTKLSINDPKALSDIVRRRELGFGEAYMEGKIDVPENELIDMVRLTDENASLFNNAFGKRMSYRYQLNAKKNHKKQIQSHYDLGNDFYSMWLDDTMTYTCAYFNSPSNTLEQAQRQKIDHILRKLQLEKGHELVDIGCGWGYLVVQAAKQYGVKSLGVTLSEEQYKFALALAKKEGVENLAKFKNINYLDLVNTKKKYDRVVSVGFFEHVGRKNHRQYMDVVSALLKPGGISVLHSIMQQTELPLPSWIDKYIFPGGYIPSFRETVQLFPEYGMRVIDVENLRSHYALTLREWLRRFDSNKSTIRSMHDERFVRMWRLYLAGSISSFEYGNNDLMQIIFTKGINSELPLTRDYMY